MTRLNHNYKPEISVSLLNIVFAQLVAMFDSEIIMKIHIISNDALKEAHRWVPLGHENAVNLTFCVVTRAG